MNEPKSLRRTAIFASLAMLVGLLPLIWYIASSTIISPGLLIFSNLIGWATVSTFHVLHRRMHAAMDQTLQGLGIDPGDTPFLKKFVILLNEFTRQHRAAFEFSAADRIAPRDLGANLRQISELAYTSLHAQAVELSLFDEGANLWSQAIVLGEPRTIASQSMLSEASASQVTNPHVLVEPLRFAGTVFGALRVEFPQEQQLPTKSDQKVLKLLGLQASMMLLNARFTEELLRMRRLGDETAQAKTGFLANLSHEIRGPLSIILNAVELSIEGLCGPVSPQLHEMLRMIESNGTHLLDLVNDVLDYAKVEAGHIKADTTTIAAKPLLKDLSSVVRSQADSKRHKLIVEDVSDTLGILCDKRHLRQMLINLLTNAIKYTPEGGTIRLKAKLSNSDRVVISVTDTGVGIPESDRDKVFGAFQRVENEYAMRQSGTGLGMPLTRRLAEINGGSVDFESRPGQGTTFFINLPATEVSPEQSVAPSESSEKAAISGKGEAVLLVDASADSRAIIAQYLQHQGFRVLTANTIEDCVPILRNNELDLALIDSDNPDTSAEDVISMLKSSPHFVHVPIVLLSAQAFIFDIERFLKLGVERCLSKPIELVDIARTIREVIDSAMDA